MQPGIRFQVSADEHHHVSKVLQSAVQEALAAIVESSDDAIVSKTLDGVIQSWNKGAERIFGYAQEEVIGKPITIIIPPDRLQEEYDILNRLRRGERIDHFETVRLAKNGRLIDISVTISPIRDATGVVIGASKVARDITEKKKSERELAAMNERLQEMVKERTKELDLALQQERAHLERFQKMIENLAFAAVAMDENFTILQVNDTFCEMFQISMRTTDMLGKNGYEFSNYIREKVADLDAYMTQLQQMLKEQKTVTGYEFALKDGRIILRDYFPIFDDTVYRGQLLLFRDVTQERRMDRTKSEFMSLASHQLRTPLTAIRWGMSRLDKRLQGSLTPSDQALFRQTYEAAVRMSMTIDAMLQISRIEAGQVRVQTKELNLVHLLEVLLQGIRSLSQEKNQTMSIDCAPDVMLCTDPVLLEEVLNNLITNAVKYTPRGGKVGVKVVNEPGHICIHVSDTGYGIPKTQQQYIFQKFFRGDNVVVHDTEGTGIGLYLSALITKLLGGTIGFTSEEGKGSIFTVTFPSGETLPTVKE
jgi:PAS domain S-box-containing protein